MILYCTREMALALKALIPLLAKEIPGNLDPEIASGLAEVAAHVADWPGEVLNPESLIPRLEADPIVAVVENQAAPPAAPELPAAPAGDTAVVPPASDAAPPT